MGQHPEERVASLCSLPNWAQLFLEVPSRRQRLCRGEQRAHRAAARSRGRLPIPGHHGGPQAAPARPGDGLVFEIARASPPGWAPGRSVAVVGWRGRQGTQQHLCGEGTGSARLNRPVIDLRRKLTAEGRFHTQLFGPTPNRSLSPLSLPPFGAAGWEK